MGLLDDCQELFDTKNLYEVLGVDKDAKDADVKKAYRKSSLKFHPDRHVNSDKNTQAEVTRKFQTVSKVHFILSDKDKRALYDDTGVIAGEDSLESEADWQDYWRILFPKITTKDIDSFLDKYIGSNDEKDDVRAAYLKYEGDMDKIFESVIAFDEDRARDIIEELIESESLEKFDKFVNEPKTKREKRKAKIAKEAKLAAKEKAKKKAEAENADDDDLVKAIQSRSKGNFNSMIASLEAKYGGGGGAGAKSSPKRKASNSAPAKRKK